MELKKEHLAILHRLLETNRRLICLLDDIARDNDKIRPLIESTMPNAVMFSADIDHEIKELMKKEKP